MGFKQAFLKLLGKDYSPMSIPYLLGAGTGNQYAPPTYSRMSMEGYEANPTVRACVDTILGGLAGLPIYLLQGDVEQPASHPLLRLLDAPNPRMSRAEFLEYVGGSLLLDGNSYIVPVNPATRTGPPIALYPLPPSHVIVDEAMSGGVRVQRYTYQPDGGRVQVYLEDQLIHIKLYHPRNGLRGLGVLASAMRCVDRSNASEQWNYSLLKNSAKQSGVLEAPPASSEQQVRQLEHVRDKMIGLENAGKPPILTGLKWTPTSMTPLDMDWLQGDVDAANKIARAFRVPGQIIGIPGSQTYANMEQAQRSLYENTIIPLANRILDKLNTRLCPLYGQGLRLMVDTDSIPALRDSQDSLYNRAAQAWWLTVNERRSMTGWDTVQDGDVLMVPANLLPINTTTPDTVEEDANPFQGGGY